MTPLILKTCAQFARLGWEVELWIPRRHNDYKSSADVFNLYGIKPRFKIRIMPVVDAMHWLGMLGFIIMVASFNFFSYLRLRKEKRAVLYAHDMRDVILPSLLGLPLFVEIHDFYESSVSLINQFVLKRTSGLIVTNSLKIKHIAERYKFPLERMIRQPNAVEASDFSIDTSQKDARALLNIPREGEIALYTGHLFSWKGVRTLADSAEYLPDNIYIYFVGGTEEDRRDMERYVQRKKLPRITFIPHQTPDKIPLYMKAADVLVLPNTAKEEASRIETSPVKLFEYMAAGKPIVASDLPSIRDIVTEREVSFAIPDDPRSFAQKITETLKNPDIADTRASLAQKEAYSHSWSARAARIDALIQQTLNNYDTVLSAYKKTVHNGNWYQARTLSWQKRLLRHPFLTLRYATIDRYWKTIIAFGLHDSFLKARTFWGDSMKVTFPDYRSIYHHGLIDGRELPVENFFVNHIRKGDVFIDVGANVGFYTLLASVLVGDSGKVHAFEPTPRTFNILTENSRDKRNVIRVNVALTERSGKTELADYGIEKSGLNTIVPVSSSIGSKPNILTVDTMTLDSYCSSRSIKPTFIKIDTEGAEEIVLKGGRKTLMAYHPALIVEVQREAPQNVVTFLSDLGYKSYQFIENTPIQYTNGDALKCPNMLFIYGN